MIRIGVKGTSREPNAPSADDRLLANRAPEGRILPILQAHCAGPGVGLAVLWGVIEPGLNDSLPGDRQAVTADARTLVSLYQCDFIAPWPLAEVAEDVRRLNIVSVGAGSVHRSYANRATMATGLSLANKVQLLFGTAVVVILAAGLVVPWFRSEELVYRSQLEVSRQLADAWLDSPAPEASTAPIPIRVVSKAEAAQSVGDPFVVEALERMRTDPNQEELFQQVADGNDIVYHYALALRGERWLKLHSDTQDSARSSSDELGGLLLIDRQSRLAAGQLLATRVYIVAAWLVASLLAVLLFWYILNRVILKPVRRLRDTADKVEQGDFSVRAFDPDWRRFRIVGRLF